MRKLVKNDDGFISIHAPRVGSDLRLAVVTQMYYISIHAPRVGSDSAPVVDAPAPEDFNPRSPCGERPVAKLGLTGCLLFQSTLPVWGATLRGFGTWR